MSFIKVFYRVIFALLAVCSTGFADMTLTLVNKTHQTLIAHFGKPLADGATSRLVLAGVEPADSTVTVGRDWKDKRVTVHWAVLGDMDTVHFTAENQQCVSTSNDKNDDGAGDQLDSVAAQSSGMNLVLINKSDKVLIAHFSMPLADGTTSRLVMAGSQDTVIVDYKWKGVPVKISWEAPIDEDPVCFTQDNQHLTSTSDDKSNNGPSDVLG